MGDQVQYVVCPALPTIFPDPHAIYVTSMFTYHYPDVWEAVRYYKNLYPKSVVLLGGIYATLCPDHAKQCGADIVSPGQHPQAKAYPPDASVLPYKADFTYLMTSFGCNRACTYCATHLLYGHGIRQLPVDRVLQELEFVRSKGFKKVWFGDDNILFDAENHINPICELIVRHGLKLEIHLPGGMTAKEFSFETARLMWAAGFREISFAIESTSDEVLRKMGRADHTGREDLIQALGYADRVGFRRGDTNVYFICGLPYQQRDDMLDTLFFLLSLGVWAHPQRWTPIPGTVDFQRLQLESAPLEKLHYKTFVAPNQDGKFLEEVYDIARFFNIGQRYTGYNPLASQVIKRTA